MPIVFDSIETAYTKAQVARSRGAGQVQLTVNADGRRGPRRYIRAFPEVHGVNGWVIRREIDEDDITCAYIVRCDVVDVLSAYAEYHAKRIETAVIKPRRQTFRRHR
jgi:hypothetical protein